VTTVYASSKSGAKGCWRRPAAAMEGRKPRSNERSIAVDVVVF
jgi:hypothetical protein